MVRFSFELEKKAAPSLEIKSIVQCGMSSVALLTLYLLCLSVGGHRAHTNTHAHALEHAHNPFKTKALDQTWSCLWELFKFMCRQLGETGTAPQIVMHCIIL